MSAPTLHLSPLDRALLSLEGLSTGDAFGECFFTLTRAEREAQALPPPPWPVTDDTMMAIDIVETLAIHNRIPEVALAQRFVQSYDPHRGYGVAMHSLLTQLAQTNGETWRADSRALFDGQGSFGNGSAMRIAPLGAFFASDLPTLLSAATSSAATTHAHPEATAGALAIALAAALVTQTSADPDPPSPQDLLAAVRDQTPPSDVRSGIDRALTLPPDTIPQKAAFILGSGARVSCPDTVPFALWSAAASLASYPDALSRTAAAGGDIDTTCAMVGGIVILRTGLASIPSLWHASRESLVPLLTPPVRQRLVALASPSVPPRP